MKDKLNITVRLGDLAPLGMVVDYEGEEEIRTAEFYVNRVFDKWYDTKPADRTSKDVLGMVALHFAKLYVLERKQNERVEAELKECESELDRILLRVGEL